MKFHKLLVFMMVFSLAVFAKSVFAQDDDDDDDDMEEPEEMDEDMWQAQMDEYTAKKADLTSQLASLTSDIDGLKRQLDTKVEAENNAKTGLYNMVGSYEGYQAYKTKFADAEKRVNACKGPDDAADIEKNIWPAIVDGGNNGKYKCMPEFWDRYNAMKKKIADCMGKMETGTYTVVKGDCLYKIAGMKNIYGDSKCWPALWDANKNGVVSAPPKVAKTIPNPNLIYPGQVLKVPPCTDASRKAAMNYRFKRKKRVMKSTTKDTGKTEMKDTKKETEKKTDKK